ncbi:Hypothetical predicted protein [Olea europaea subsp. europaea]|uniref:Uncharacterized protein n=1 Tax=Olea europaea subsp. europaea TaxID=158383 RepID=A0A8S0UK63_OLEEU|nr:Hypothetical predicted protein [Olea europaea subsp. europaea]
MCASVLHTRRRQSRATRRDRAGRGGALKQRQRKHTSARGQHLRLEDRAIRRLAKPWARARWLGLALPGPIAPRARCSRSLIWVLARPPSGAASGPAGERVADARPRKHCEKFVPHHRQRPIWRVVLLVRHERRWRAASVRNPILACLHVCPGAAAPRRRGVPLGPPPLARVLHRLARTHIHTRF